MNSLVSKIDWKKINGLIPVIIQDARTRLVLMLGYMNRAALRKTLTTKRVWFYSRTKKRLWMKGETSKNIIKFVGAKLDCDSDTLLIKALPTGSACHNGTSTCFNENYEDANIFDELYEVILSRKKAMPKNSYTAFLFRKGLKKMCAKIKEESAEVIKAAKRESKQRLVEEAADALFHLFVLLAQKNIGLGEIKKELAVRNKK